MSRPVTTRSCSHIDQPIHGLGACRPCYVRLPGVMQSHRLAQNRFYHEVIRPEVLAERMLVAA
jgi:hypothetical protein